MKELGLIPLIGAVVLFSSHSTHSQLSITNTSPQVINFSSTIAGVNNGAYNGSGFQPVPTAGRLDSDAWAVTGLSSGTLTFGGTQIGGVYGRGQTNVAESVAGFWAYTGAPGSVVNPSFMIQPSAGDFTPGTLTLRIRNNHATDNITQLNVSYNIFRRNDVDRSNSFNFSHSPNDTTYTPVAALDYTSPATATSSAWIQVGSSPSRSTSITGLNIAPGGFFYIRWSSDDVGGSSDRDEFGLDDITVTATFSAPLAADVSIGGRVLTSNGRGIRSVYLTLAGGTLAEPLSAITSSFGYYRFEGLQAGHTYLLTVNAKRYSFATPTRVFTLNHSVSNIEFVSEP